MEIQMFSKAYIFARQHPDWGCTVPAPFVQGAHSPLHHPAQKPNAIAIHPSTQGQFPSLEFVTFGLGMLCSGPGSLLHGVRRLQKW